MPASPLIVLDEDQERWLVCEGDPGWESAHRLLLLGYRSSRIALPRSMIVRGRRRADGAIGDLVPLIQKLEKAWKATGDEDLREGYVWMVRMYDCLAALEHEREKELIP